MFSLLKNPYQEPVSSGLQASRPQQKLSGHVAGQVHPERDRQAVVTERGLAQTLVLKVTQVDPALL